MPEIISLYDSVDYDVDAYWKLWDTQLEILTRDLVTYTLNNYYDRTIDVVDTVAPQDGFCLPIRPDRRTTSSPTGGVVGRYLRPSTSRRIDLGDEDSSSTYSSPMTIDAFSPLQARDGNVPAFDHRASADIGYKQTPGSDEERNFLFLSHDSKPGVKQMGRLKPAHPGRPGANTVCVDPSTNELFAKIPRIPYAPKEADGRTEYKLRTYEEYQQVELGHARKKLYPPFPGSSLVTCNHCNLPTSVLQNESLCPYHAYYLVTKQYLGYYELCALIEMEKRGLSIANGWWTIEEMAKFIPFLTTKLRRWSLVFDSEEIDLKTTWSTKASPFGAVKETVPPSSHNKSGRELGMQLRFIERFDGLDENKIGPRIAQVIRNAKQPSPLVQAVSRKLKTNIQPQIAIPSIPGRTQHLVATPMRPAKRNAAAMNDTYSDATLRYHLPNFPVF